MTLPRGLLERAEKANTSDEAFKDGEALAEMHSRAELRVVMCYVLCAVCDVLWSGGGGVRGI